MGTETERKEHKMTGGDLRTHLANERTFLAWCRTSIALIVFGFVIERFDFFLLMMSGTDGMPAHSSTDRLYYISLFAFAMSAAIIVISGYRFLSLRQMIRKGEMTVSVFPEVMVVISMVIIISMVIFLVFNSGLHA